MWFEIQWLWFGCVSLARQWLRSEPLCLSHKCRCFTHRELVAGGNLQGSGMSSISSAHDPSAVLVNTHSVCHGTRYTLSSWRKAPMGIGLFFFGAAKLVSRAHLQYAMGFCHAVQDSMHLTHDFCCGTAPCRPACAQRMTESAYSGLHKQVIRDLQPLESALQRTL